MNAEFIRRENIAKVKDVLLERKQALGASDTAYQRAVDAAMQEIDARRSSGWACAVGNQVLRAGGAW